MRKLENALKQGGAGASRAAGQAATSFADQAAARGLADLSYALVPTPLGDLVAVASRRGLVKLSFDPSRVDAVLDDLATRLSPRIIEAPNRLVDARRQLEQYFEGSRTRFDLPLDWSLSAGFSRRVLRAAARIPYGRSATYREVATKAGSPAAVRAAGNALAANPVPIVVPCHRVLRTGGGLGGYAGGLAYKRYLLELEQRSP